MDERAARQYLCSFCPRRPALPVGKQQSSRVCARKGFGLDAERTELLGELGGGRHGYRAAGEGEGEDLRGLGWLVLVLFIWTVGYKCNLDLELLWRRDAAGESYLVSNKHTSNF